jgi:hypothetical protein
MGRIGKHVAAAVIGLLVATQANLARGAIVVGQVDDFESGGLLDWSGGTNNPNPPANVASGGPAGVDDNFLRITANSSGGSGGKIIAFNSTQWAGDYGAAGVGSIRMRVSNAGATDITLRLILIATTTVTTVDPVILLAGSGWQTVTFSLAPSNLTDGATSPATLGNVTELNLLHAPTPVTNRQNAPFLAGVLDVDNITAVAVPEPATLGVLAACSIGLMTRRRGRHAVFAAMGRA